VAAAGHDRDKQLAKAPSPTLDLRPITAARAAGSPARVLGLVQQSMLMQFNDLVLQGRGALHDGLLEGCGGGA
jgi:hypothetical protein